MPENSVILLPGGMLPAEPAYAPLIEALGDGVRAVAKDLEVYAGDAPPPGYSLGTEVEGVLRVAEEAGLERFHLVGFSAGGASAVAFAAAHPDRLRSLALIEPAWLGNEEQSERERADRARMADLAGLPPAQMLEQFRRLQLAPGVVPPSTPHGDPPPWLAKRPAGLAAIGGAFAGHRLDLDALRALDAPVYFALGTLSNQDRYGENARRAEELFADFTLDVYEGRHHFDPPHLAEPGRLAAALRALWRRAPA
ncbi:MAG: alpha/beta hydrolase [Thermoleophilaceae bacterium]